MKTDTTKKRYEDSPRNPYLKNYNEKLFQTYQKGAEQGNASDINNLGICYQKGKGTEKNHLKAMQCYLRAARMDYAPAMFNLGLAMCREGQTCRKGLEESLYWFDMAAERGIPEAFWEMGNAYHDGLGTNVSYEDALRWFKMGMDRGDAACKCDYALMMFKGEGIPEDEAGAVALWKEASDDADSGATFYLGCCYQNGYGGVRKNLMKAAELFERADILGNANADETLEQMLKDHPLFNLVWKLHKARHNWRYTFTMIKNKRKWKKLQSKNSLESLLKHLQ